MPLKLSPAITTKEPHLVDPPPWGTPSLGTWTVLDGDMNPYEVECYAFCKFMDSKNNMLGPSVWVNADEYRSMMSQISESEG